MRNAIYSVILLLIISFFIFLPLVSIPISSSSLGLVRSVQENTQVSAVVSGKVVYSKLERNNQTVQKGDTLLIVTTEQLDTQKQLQNNQSSDYAAQLLTCPKYRKANFLVYKQDNTSEKFLLCKRK